MYQKFIPLSFHGNKKHSQDSGNKTHFELVITRFKLNLIILSEMNSDKFIPTLN